MQPQLAHPLLRRLHLLLVPDLQHHEHDEDDEEQDHEADDEHDGDGQLTLDVELGGEPGEDAALLGVVEGLGAVPGDPAYEGVVPGAEAPGLPVPVVGGVQSDLALSQPATTRWSTQ